MGAGIRLGCGREAYDAELIGLQRGLQSLVDGPSKGAGYMAFTGSRTAMLHIQNDAPGQRQVPPSLSAKQWKQERFRIQGATGKGKAQKHDDRSRYTGAVVRLLGITRLGNAKEGAFTMG